jgi:hypothetical protein
MPEDQPSRMLAVILGASVFPESPKLAESRAFYISHADVKDYFSQEGGLAIPKPNIFSLFDDSRSPPDQLTDIAKFLSRRLGALRNEGSPAQDLLFYYVGHGLFTRGAQEVLSRSSFHERNQRERNQHQGERSGLGDHGPRRFPATLSDSGLLLFRKCLSGIPILVRLTLYGRRFSTSCLNGAPRCSVPQMLAKLPWPEGREHTMFSGALIKALRQGHQACGPRLSFSELGALVEETLRNEYPQNWVRPEVFSPNRRAGDIANIPFFPNPAYVGQRQAEEQAARVRIARQQAEAAERERLAQAEAERQAAEKAERERLEREKAEHEGKKKADQEWRERVAAVERERISRKTAEAVRQAGEKAEAGSAQPLRGEATEELPAAQNNLGKVLGAIALLLVLTVSQHLPWLPNVTQAPEKAATIAGTPGAENSSATQDADSF